MKWPLSPPATILVVGLLTGGLFQLALSARAETIGTGCTGDVASGWTCTATVDYAPTPDWSSNGCLLAVHVEVDSDPIGYSQAWMDAVVAAPDGCEPATPYSNTTPVTVADIENALSYGSPALTDEPVSLWVAFSDGFDWDESYDDDPATIARYALPLTCSRPDGDVATCTEVIEEPPAEDVPGDVERTVHGLLVGSAPFITLAALMAGAYGWPFYRVKPKR